MKYQPTRLTNPNLKEYIPRKGDLCVVKYKNGKWAIRIIVCTFWFKWVSFGIGSRKQISHKKKQVKIIRTLENEKEDWKKGNISRIFLLGNAVNHSKIKCLASSQILFPKSKLMYLAMVSLGGIKCKT